MEFDPPADPRPRISPRWNGFHAAASSLPERYVFDDRSRHEIDHRSRIRTAVRPFTSLSIRATARCRDRSGTGPRLALGEREQTAVGRLWPRPEAARRRTRPAAATPDGLNAFDP